MTSENKKLIAVLRAKQKDLSRSLRNRDGIAVETASEALEESQSKAERELATGSLNRDSSIFRLIELALARIANGTYGICLRCEEDISPKHIAAVPWTAFCIKCQERIDRREINIDQEAPFRPCQTLRT